MLLRQYETVVIVHPGSGDEGLERVLGRYRDALGKTGGQEVRVEDWGRRRLAYRLKKCSKGHYLYCLYLGTDSTVAELERLFGITEEALKYQTILLDGRVNVEEFDFEKARGEVTPYFKMRTDESSDDGPSVVEADGADDDDEEDSDAG